MNRVIVKSGNIYSISLENGNLGYAQALESPEFAFFEVTSKEELCSSEVVQQPVIFRIWVHKSAPKTWNKIGKESISPALAEQVPRFKQDKLNGKISIYLNSQEKLATLEDVKGLECAAVWAPSHITSRLQDYFAGLENKWVLSLQPK